MSSFESEAIKGKFNLCLLLFALANPDDLNIQTLKTGQISENDFLGSTITKNLMAVLSDIRDAHVTDNTTADTTATDSMKEAFDTATKFAGSQEESQVAVLLGQLKIKYESLTKEELVTLINILRKSPLLKTPGSKRGKGKKKNRK